MANNLSYSVVGQFMDTAGTLGNLPFASMEALKIWKDKHPAFKLFRVFSNVSFAWRGEYLLANNNQPMKGEHESNLVLIMAKNYNAILNGRFRKFIHTEMNMNDTVSEFLRHPNKAEEITAILNSENEMEHSKRMAEYTDSRLDDGFYSLYEVEQIFDMERQILEIVRQDTFKEIIVPDSDACRIIDEAEIREIKEDLVKYLYPVFVDLSKTNTSGRKLENVQGILIGTINNEYKIIVSLIADDLNRTEVHTLTYSPQKFIDILLGKRPADYNWGDSLYTDKMKEQHKRLFADCLAFIIQYRLLEKVDKPVVTLEEKHEKRMISIDGTVLSRNQNNPSFFTHKIVHLTEEYKYPKSKRKVPSSTLSKEGKHQEPTPVRAHIRQLINDTGEVKIIYVRAYERDQWKNDRVIIKTVRE